MHVAEQRAENVMVVVDLDARLVRQGAGDAPGVRDTWRLRPESPSGEWPLEISCGRRRVLDIQLRSGPRRRRTHAFVVLRCRYSNRGKLRDLLREIVGAS